MLGDRGYLRAMWLLPFAAAANKGLSDAKAERQMAICRRSLPYHL